MDSCLTLEELEKLRVLGEGTYGKCYLVHNKRNDELCVLKQIEIFGMSEEEQQEVIKEARILSVLNHPHITRFLAFFKSENYINIVMEYADGGDLNKLIKEAAAPFSENKILDWFTQLCLAIKHIHDRKVIHRDLKSQNIFTTRSGELKLGDFGIAKHLNRTLDKIKTVVGTPYYMSPEICENKDYSFKTDIWSLGIILYEMCALKLPFDGNSLPVLALKISKGDYPPLTGNYSKELKKLLASLLHLNPNRRPTINKILQASLICKRITKFLPKQVLSREFSHTTLHSINIFEKENSSAANEDSSETVASRQREEADRNVEVKSARGHAQQIKAVKTPQAKNGDCIASKLREFGSNGKSGGKNDKKKRIDAFKRREASEPNLNHKKVLSKNDPSCKVIEEEIQAATETIEETLMSIIQERLGEPFCEKLEEVGEGHVLGGESFEGRGLLALLWGMREYGVSN